MCVMTSKRQNNKFVCSVKIQNPPEYNLPDRERTLTGPRSILAGSKSRVLPTTPFLVKTIQTRAGRAILTVTSRTCAVHETTPLSTSERRT